VSEPTIANCPVCQQSALGYAQYEKGGFVYCEQCTMRGPQCVQKVDAIALWNRLSRAARLLAAVEAIDPLRIKPFHEIHIHHNGAFLYNGGGWAGTFGTGEPLADALIQLAEATHA
jgi:hypothetical protein